MDQQLIKSDVFYTLWNLQIYFRFHFAHFFWISSIYA